jgi:hypothetical protein
VTAGGGSQAGALPRWRGGDEAMVPHHVLHHGIGASQQQEKLRDEGQIGGGAIASEGGRGWPQVGLSRDDSSGSGSG